MGAGQSTANGDNGATANELAVTGDAVERTNRFAYPQPENQLYFGSQFFLGGQQFSSFEPEAYLFGAMTDLNFLANGRVGVLPQPAPPLMRHTTTIRSFVNMKKDTLRLVKASVPGLGENDEPYYYVEFYFDADVQCAITLYFCATQVLNENNDLDFQPFGGGKRTTRMVFQKGYGQKFHAPNLAFRLSSLPQEHTSFLDVHVRVAAEGGNPTDPNLRQVFPCVILIEAHSQARLVRECSTDIPIPLTSDGIDREVDGSRTRSTQSQFTVGSFERSGGDDATLANWSIKPVKQALHIGGVTYVMQEIFGIERTKETGAEADPVDDSQTECVVCMTDPRDTAVLPCRHLCLCHSCADVLRYQSNKCPICRSLFHSLLQMRVAQKIEATLIEEEGGEDGAAAAATASGEEVAEGNVTDGKGARASKRAERFRAVPIVEALMSNSSTSSAPARANAAAAAAAASAAASAVASASSSSPTVVDATGLSAAIAEDEAANTMAQSYSVQNASNANTGLHATNETVVSIPSVAPPLGATQHHANATSRTQLLNDSADNNSDDEPPAAATTTGDTLPDPDVVADVLLGIPTTAVPVTDRSLSIQSTGSSLSLNHNNNNNDDEEEEEEEEEEAVEEYGRDQASAVGGNNPFGAVPRMSADTARDNVEMRNL